MSLYHPVYSDRGLRRPRRLPCFSGVSLLAAGLLGLLVGIAFTAVLGAAVREGEARPVNCLLRSPAVDGLQVAAITGMSGVCRVER